MGARFTTTRQWHVSDLHWHWCSSAIWADFQVVNPSPPSAAYIAWSAPNHYLNRCWNIFNWALRNKLQWNFSRKSHIFIQENALENVACEMAAILSRGRWVKGKKNFHSRQAQHSPWSQMPTATAVQGGGGPWPLKNRANSSLLRHEAIP